MRAIPRVLESLDMNQSRTWSHISPHTVTTGHLVHLDRPHSQFYFTVDCDWVPGSQRGFERLLDLNNRFHLKNTIFYAARFTETYPARVRECPMRGHLLETHGWAHGGLKENEGFCRASYPQ